MGLIDANALKQRIMDMFPSMSQPDGSGIRDPFVFAVQDALVDVLNAIEDLERSSSVTLYDNDSYRE